MCRECAAKNQQTCIKFFRAYFGINDYRDSVPATAFVSKLPDIELSVTQIQLLFKKWCIEEYMGIAYNGDTLPTELEIVYEVMTGKRPYEDIIGYATGKLGISKRVHKDDNDDGPTVVVLRLDSISGNEADKTDSKRDDVRMPTPTSRVKINA